MVERKAKVICSVVGFLGLLSAALGFAAEAKKIKASQIRITTSSCTYPSSPALGLGFTAALALLVAQIIISTTTGCFCCRRGPYQANSNRTLAVICFVVSWITFVNAFLMLLSGAALNAHREEDNTYLGTYACFYVKPGIFAGAAVLSLATVVLGIGYYLLLDSGKISNNSWGGPATAPNQGGIAMAHPQVPAPQYPPSNADPSAPVFVHEDTYMRRQFS
ncbi:hypothetical protein Vadar_018273 [Vaccinium darrowii]|uniref:Uncharacterized protein n=1 Tax=Vaccinium darrowii TaxID=229202 RepID=A0ACB7YMU9_9ERIC|nr:hypothetical protein Vadar_018273 [Vaccinium darrowii]